VAMATIPRAASHLDYDRPPSAVSCVRFSARRGGASRVIREFTPAMGRNLPFPPRHDRCNEPYSGLTDPSADASGDTIAYRERAEAEGPGGQHVIVYLLWVWQRSLSQPWLLHTLVRYEGLDDGDVQYSLGADGKVTKAEADHHDDDLCVLTPSISADGRKLAYFLGDSVVVVDLP
jgi:hypothetical protein